METHNRNNGELAAVSSTPWLSAVVLRHYEPIADADAIRACAGAQQLNGKWYMPIWGCDTLAHLIEDIEHASARAEKGDTVKAVGRQWRLRWKRVGYKEKRKVFWSERAAQRRIVLMGPEPWKALGTEPDEHRCCSGEQCGCGGETWREHLLSSRGDMPPLEYTIIESREVSLGKWTSNNDLSGRR
jgi:hypothetical protein